MEYEYEDAENKQQRQRVIIITTAIAILVLGIAAWAIIAIVGSRSQDTAENSEVVAATDDTTTREKTVETQPAPAVENTAKVTTTKQTTTTKTSKEAVPETGPEELLPLALVAGTAVAYISSRKFATRNA